MLVKPVPVGFSIAFACLEVLVPMVADTVLLVRVTTPPVSNLEAVTQIAATIVEVAGKRMLEVYGRQARKLFDCVLDEGVRAGKAGFPQSSLATITLLVIQLEEAQSTGKITGEEGRELRP